MFRREESVYTTPTGEKWAVPKGHVPSEDVARFLVSLPGSMRDKAADGLHGGSQVATDADQASQAEAGPSIEEPRDASLYSEAEGSGTTDDDHAAALEQGSVTPPDQSVAGLQDGLLGTADQGDGLARGDGLNGSGSPKKGRPPVVEADSAVEGIYITRGDLRVDGLVKGEVICLGTLVIGEGGSVQARVQAGEIVVAGRLMGEVQCQGKIEILPLAWVEGKVAASSVCICDGAYFTGELGLRSQPAQDRFAPSQSLIELLEKRMNGGLSIWDLTPASVGETDGRSEHTADNGHGWPRSTAFS